MDDTTPAKPPIREEDLVGFKYFRSILPMLGRLHDDGCGRDKAHNRSLHYDQYTALLLLFFFNPIVTSMRGLVQASSLDKVRQKLGVLPTSLGSFSEAASVFDPDLLEGIVKELGAQLKPLKHDTRLDQVPGILTLVDGTVVSALAKLVGHLGKGTDGKPNRDIKLHTHFELLKGVPADIDLTKATDSEVQNLLGRLLPDRVYVDDRGYACFRLFQAVIDAGSHFVGRIRDNSKYEVIEDRPLSAEARAAGILSDQIVWLGCDGKRDELRQPLRILKIACTPHTKRMHNGRGGPQQGEFLLIATDLLDLPAEVIGLIYKSRWTVEIFFRFFKHVLGSRHLLSHREEGIRIQVYMAIIACMLITLWSGRNPTLRTVEMIQFYFTGWASEAELEAHIAKLKKQDE
jgi:Transposase DDE domain